MKRFWFRRLAAGSLMLLGATGASAGESVAVPVFVSILPQAAFVEAVGGSRVAVWVMVGPGQSPATYEPSPRQMTELGRARLYFRIGVPFESAWIGRIRRLRPDLRIVDTRQGIRLMPMRPPRELGADAGEGEAHGHESGRDPHIWLDPMLVKVQARTIRDALVAEIPEGREEFDRNLERFEATLDALDARIRTILAPLTNRRFMDFHPSWGYFARAYGLEEISIEIEGKDPGPRTLEALVALARRDGIRTIFVQPQFSAKAARVIASQIGGRVAPLDPLARDYLPNLEAAAAAIAGSAP